VKTYNYNRIWVSLFTILCFILSILFIFFTFNYDGMPESYGEMSIFLIFFIPIIIIGLGINYCKRQIIINNKSIILEV
jgi:hypothetical protein